MYLRGVSEERYRPGGSCSNGGVRPRVCEGERSWVGEEVRDEGKRAAALGTSRRANPIHLWHGRNP